MDINLLVQRLKHGESYIAQNGDNGPYQVNCPPNSLMIKAANVIEQLSTHLQQQNQAVTNLQRQLNELSEQYETLRTIHTTTTSS